MTSPLTPGMWVRIYWNVRKKQYSVQVKVGTNHARWYTCYHVPEITLKHATPIVSAAGIAKIRATKRKRVVAKIHGMVVANGATAGNYNWDLVHFNPYDHDGFVYGTHDHPWSGSGIGYLDAGSFNGRPCMRWYHS